MNHKTSKPKKVPRGMTRLTPVEHAEVIKRGYVQRGDRFLYASECEETQTKAQRINELRKMKCDRAVRINIGTTARMDHRVQFFARASYEFHEGIGGLILLLPPKSKAAEAAAVFKYLLKFTDDSTLWKTLQSNPTALSKHFYDVRRECWNEDRKAAARLPLDDDNAETWPKDRWKAASEAFQGVAAMSLLRMSQAERLQLIQHHPTASKIERDVVAFINGFVRQLESMKQSDRPSVHG
jgi:hypothetical protein